MEQGLQHYLLENIPGLLESDLDLLNADITFKKFDSDEIYIYPGETKKKIYFIKSGIVRIYHLQKNRQNKMKDKTILFHSKNSFFGNYDSITFGNPSRYFYQSVGETELFELSYESIDNAAQHSVNLNNLRSQILLEMIGRLLNNIEDFVLLTAKERFQKQININSEIFLKAPANTIASLIGITPVSLSRIKRRVYKGE